MGIIFYTIMNIAFHITRCEDIFHAENNFIFLVVLPFLYLACIG